MERQIGERFLDNGVELEVCKRELEFCDGCYYFDNLTKVNCSDDFHEKLLGRCNNVIFKEVEK